MTVARLDARFAALKAEARAAFVAYVMAGDPDLEGSFEVLRGLPAAGADVIELGFPFSDPMAEGPPIQRASLRALKAGATLASTLELVRRFRAEDAGTPLILMGYLNPVLTYGYARFAGEAAAAGVDGLIVVDCPPEESDELADALEARLRDGAEPAEAVLAVVKDKYTAHKRIVFNGDNYAEEWHAEAKQRGLLNLRTTPDALPWLVDEQTVAVFGNYNVLSERELESRYEVFLEQYVTKLNIEAETAASIARTMILPAAVRHLNELKRTDLDGLVREVSPIVEELVGAIQVLEKANRDHPEECSTLEHAEYMRDTVVPAMNDVRAIADGLERLVADDLWPLPKYEEMLFIK